MKNSSAQAFPGRGRGGGGGEAPVTFLPRGATRKFHLLHFSGPKRQRSFKFQLRGSSTRAPRTRPHSFLPSSAEATGRVVGPVGVWPSRQRFTHSATSGQRRDYPTSPGRCANLRLRPAATHRPLRCCGQEGSGVHRRQTDGPQQAQRGACGHRTTPT